MRTGTFPLVLTLHRACIGVAAALASTASYVASAEPLRPFTISDSIEMSDFVPSSAFAATAASPAPESPDGRHIAAVTMRGDLKNGKRVATLWLIDRAAITGGNLHARAQAIGTFSSGSNRDPVGDWRWSSDSRSIYFLGADDDGIRRLYRLDLTSRRIEPLTRADLDVNRYDERGGAIAFLAQPPIRSADLYQASPSNAPDAVVGTGQGILSMLFPNWYASNFQQSPDQLWTIGKKGAVPVLHRDGRTPVLLKDSRIAISPDGRRVLATRHVPDIPKSWESYKSPLDLPGMDIVADTPEKRGSTSRNRLQQYVTIDLGTGETSLLLDAPIAMVSRLTPATPQWSTDGSAVALPYFYQPLAAGDTSARASILPCPVMIVSFPARNWSCPRDAQSMLPGEGREDLRLAALEWAGGTGDLVAHFTRRATPDHRVDVRFRKAGNEWTAQIDRNARPAAAVSARVEQDLNKRPMLVGRNAEGTAQTLLDPNPQLDRIAMGSAELYHWLDTEGNKWTGALVKPSNFVPGKRYPLVIQTHNLEFGKFLVDGPSATGFAARAIAARDILVLQVDEIRKDFGTKQESATGAAGYRAAIAQLAKDGLVDSAKVGIIAWSHMGPYVMKALVDEPKTYAAATFAEASYNSYGEYLMNVDYLGPEREQYMRAQVGTKPFGDGLSTWIKEAPGFQTDRVCTPILRQINTPIGLVYGWDGYAALRAQKKPIELFYLRQGAHVLVKPRERLLEQGMNVDWYDYWLNDRRDPDPAKAAQYLRWDGLRALRICRN